MESSNSSPSTDVPGYNFFTASESRYETSGLEQGHRHEGTTNLAANLTTAQQTPPQASNGVHSNTTITALQDDTLEALSHLPKSSYLDVHSPSSTRPSTASSGTHASSLRLGAFSRPMSSLRLQAHRAARPSSFNSPRDSSIEYDDTINTATPTPTIGVSNAHGTEELNTGSGPTSTAAPSFAAPSWMDNQDFQQSMYPDSFHQHADSEDTKHDPSNHPSAMKTVDEAEQRHDMPARDLEKGSHWEPQQTTVQAPPRVSTQRFASLAPTAILNRIGQFHRTSSGLSSRSRHEKLASREQSPRPPPRNRSSGNKNAKAKISRNWEFSESNMIFCFEGRFLNARKRPIVLVTWFLVVFPSILYFIFSAPYLWHHSSAAVPLLYAYVLFLALSSLWHASVSDPGIYPRNLHIYPPPAQNEDPLALGPPTTTWTQVRSATASFGIFEVPTKYCKTCNIWRPPRCHHCRLCDCCVDTQDHHCVWLNNCVGRRNYRYFFSFVTATAVLAIWLMGSSVGAISRYASLHNISFSKALGANSQNGVSFFLFLYGLFGFPYPLALCVYHVHLMIHAETTREVLTSRGLPKKDRHRPFDQNSWWKNLFVVLVRPRPPAYMQFKREHIEGDQRQGALQKQQNTAGEAIKTWAQMQLHTRGLRMQSDPNVLSQAEQGSNSAQQHGLPHSHGHSGVEMQELASRYKNKLSGIFKNSTPRG